VIPRRAAFGPLHHWVYARLIPGWDPAPHCSLDAHLPPTPHSQDIQLLRLDPTPAPTDSPDLGGNPRTSTILQLRDPTPHHAVASLTHLLDPSLPSPRDPPRVGWDCPTGWDRRFCLVPHLPCLGPGMVTGTLPDPGLDLDMWDGTPLQYLQLQQLPHTPVVAQRYPHPRPHPPSFPSWSSAYPQPGGPPIPGVPGLPLELGVEVGDWVPTPHPPDPRTWVPWAQVGP